MHMPMQVAVIMRKKGSFLLEDSDDGIRGNAVHPGIEEALD